MGFIRNLIVFILPFIICINNAFALRPFVTTNADVVEKGKIELEFGYFGIKEEKNPGTDEITIEFPSISIHYGLLWDSEFTMETVGEFIDDRQKGSFELREQQFSDTGVFLKKVWHWGEGIVPNFQPKREYSFLQKKGAKELILRV